MDPTPNAPPAVPGHDAARRSAVCEPSRYAVFACCPQCGGEMRPEHAHYRCAACGWRDSCCD